jgi:DtxR family Mn-dependent transcriptional regulator
LVFLKDFPVHLISASAYLCKSMKQTSFTEENYLKAIYKLTSEQENRVSTNAIAGLLDTRASSVTDMIKKLCEKGLVNYAKYQGVMLTGLGESKALQIVRKHRLWEVFLVNQLGLGWDEVHDIAEQLEHTESERLYDFMDRFLNYPKVDPHGDPIPDRAGKIDVLNQIRLTDVEPGTSVLVSGVLNHSAEFLQYLQDISLTPGSEVFITRTLTFDGAVEIRLLNGKELLVSGLIGSAILVKSALNG